MTNLRTLSLLTPVSAQSRKENSVGKVGSSKTVYVVFVLCIATAIASHAQTLTTLVDFNESNGAGPGVSLIQGTDGNLYGTTSTGGNLACNPPYGCGTIFKLSPGGALTTLYNFCSKKDCTDGEVPDTPLVQASNGDFYGTTGGGGSRHLDACSSYYNADGCGTIFKITPAGKLTKLHTFEGTDGWIVNGVAQGADGNFYGTTSRGFGAAQYGTVFKITPAGKFTTLYYFCSQPNCSDGALPFGLLVQATDGNFYGTTGGSGGYDFGTVFKITPAGVLTTLCSVEGIPDTGLVQATDGNFYGTTWQSNYDGEVFRVTPEGVLTVLDYIGDGDPMATLAQATDGNLYGTLPIGGTHDCDGLQCGAIFEVTLGGTLMTLYNFCSEPNCPDGQRPDGGLIQSTNGTLYGTTADGGNGNCEYGCGTVFSLDLGLGPFVRTNPTSGKVGAAVIVLGTNLTGAGSVSFNGTIAKFTVFSATEIKTKVPKGATTGPVTVTTPSGTLTSNVPFIVQ